VGVGGGWWGGGGGGGGGGEKNICMSGSSAVSTGEMW